MPDERDLPDEFDTPDDYDSEQFNDDDVPFKLPKAEASSRPTEPDDVEADSPVAGAHQMPTMPVFHEPGVPDPKETLPGTGGLDPNPDFVDQNTVKNVSQSTQPPPSQATMRHQAVHMPEDMPIPGMTQPHNAPDHQQYQRPSQPPAQYMPPQPPAQRPINTQGSRPLPPRRRKRSRKILGLPRTFWWVFLGTMVTFCGGLTLISVILFGMAYTQIDGMVQEAIAKVDDYQNFESTFIYDRYGDQLWEAFGEGRRTNVPFDQFPQYLIDATIAIEDDSFFSNPGIDVGSTTVAILQYLGASPDENTPGGSTITQQVVRNILFDPEYRAERSVQRKVEEILLALALTQRKSKEEILGLYLNEIYFGNLAYGAEAAAQTFFGKHVSDLTLGEAALLAGLPQAPADLDPLNPDPATQAAVYERWRQVLSEMVEEGYITSQQRDDTLHQGLTFMPPEVSLVAPHFTVYAQGELERLMRDLGYSPDAIANGGLKVYTTIDLRINELAQQAVRDQISRLTANNVTNGAVVVIKPITGEILAMVGSADYHNDAIDGRVNVTTSLRQPGSSIKPFNYAAAMERGMTPGDVIWDTPTEIGLPGQADYVPRNYDGAFHGPVRLRTALANSYNIPAVQTLRSRVGVDYLLALLHRFGVSALNEDPSQYGLSLTLGGGEVSPIELTQAYAVFANQGVLVPVTSILCVIDNHDNIIYQYENSCPGGRVTENTVERVGLGTQVLDPRIAFVISDILADNNARTPAMGANSPLRTDGILSSVKTGTTNDIKDNWTVGYTRNVAIGVWVGNSNGDPMRNSSGLTGAAPIWNAVITGIYNNPDLLAAMASGGQLLPDQITPPPGMTLRQICNLSTLADPATQCSTQAEWFLDGPAGVPDENGNLNYPPAQQSQQSQPSSGPWLREYEPGVYVVLVHAIPPSIAAGIQFNVQPGETAPPSPLYCQVPVELAASDPTAHDQLFIAPPPIPEDAIAAEQYARNHNLAYLPTIACTAELLTAQDYGPQVATAVITSPYSGQSISTVVPIMGTVQFSPDQATHYHFFIKGGQFGDWTPLGEMHMQSVVNGQLEILHADALQRGQNYQLQLRLFKGENLVQSPFEIWFAVP